MAMVTMGIERRCIKEKQIKPSTWKNSSKTQFLLISDLCIGMLTSFFRNIFFSFFIFLTSLTHSYCNYPHLVIFVNNSLYLLLYGLHCISLILLFLPTFHQCFSYAQLYRCSIMYIFKKNMYIKLIEEMENRFNEAEVLLQKQIFFSSLFFSRCNSSFLENFYPILQAVMYSMWSFLKLLITLTDFTFIIQKLIDISALL